MKSIRVDLPEDVVLVKREELRKLLFEVYSDFQKEEDEILTLQEAAKYLKVSAATLRKLVNSKDVPHFQKGQVIRFNKKALRIWTSEVIAKGKE